MSRAAGILWFLCCCFSITLAKKSPEQILDPHLRATYLEHPSVATFKHIALPHLDEPEQEAYAYLWQTDPNLADERTDLQLLHRIQSLSGIHLTYQQTFDGYPVIGATVKVNLDRKGDIWSIFNGSFPTSKWSTDALRPKLAKVHQQHVLHYAKRFSEQATYEAAPHILVNLKTGQPEAITLVTITDLTQNQKYDAFLDPSGLLIMELDQVRYANTDTMVAAQIFLPDPLTTAEVEYGGSYVDSNDIDLDVLNDERVQVNMVATEDGGIFTLRSPYVLITHFSPPNIPAAVNSVPEFFFTRDLTGFEDVNAFYHIHYYQEYLQSLGFTDLVNTQLPVDAHAYNDSDQSGYLPGTPGQIGFGEGGVDDAEDADVVIHEYGHAISYAANVNRLSTSSWDRQAIDEAFGDYIAATYSKSLSDYRWDDVFTWDGHNEFWPGRTVSSDKRYPDDINSQSIHLTGEIYAAFLADIFLELGREASDFLVFQSLYAMQEGMSMPQAAQVMLQMDSIFNNGVNSCLINSLIIKRGLGMNTTPNVPPGFTLVTFDTEICADSAIMLYAQGNGQVTWQPAEFLDDPMSNTPISSPPVSTQFVAEIIISPSCILRDSIYVQVNNCSTAGIAVRNLYGFSDGSAPLQVLVPLGWDFATVELYDMAGRLQYRAWHQNDDNILIPPEGLSQGVYILQVSTLTERFVEKVIKLR